MTILCAHLRSLAIVAMTALLCTSTAAAQSPAALPGRYSLAAAARWTGHTTVGATDATETAVNGGRFQLFRTTTKLAPAVGMEGRIGIRLTRSIEAEASISFAKPDLETRVTFDAEGAPNLTASDTMKELT